MCKIALQNNIYVQKESINTYTVERKLDSIYN